jgi:hypothetical protein
VPPWGERRKLSEFCAKAVASPKVRSKIKLHSTSYSCFTLSRSGYRQLLTSALIS